MPTGKDIVIICDENTLFDYASLVAEAAIQTYSKLNGSLVDKDFVLEHLPKGLVALHDAIIEEYKLGTLNLTDVKSGKDESVIVEKHKTEINILLFSKEKQLYKGVDTLLDFFRDGKHAMGFVSCFGNAQAESFLENTSSRNSKLSFRMDAYTGVDNVSKEVAIMNCIDSLIGKAQSTGGELSDILAGSEEETFADTLGKLASFRQENGLEWNVLIPRVIDMNSTQGGYDNVIIVSSNPDYLDRSKLDTTLPIITVGIGDSTYPTDTNIVVPNMVEYARRLTDVQDMMKYVRQRLTHHKDTPFNTFLYDKMKRLKIGIQILNKAVDRDYDQFAALILGRTITVQDQERNVLHKFHENEDVKQLITSLGYTEREYQQATQQVPLQPPKPK
tara:strand:- start:1924 stop:3090 length:1167 start_codon:yes stop_codon:yes gene_type:complete